MKTPKYTPLSWETEYDQNDNTVWVAASFAHDDGSPFFYRIAQKLRADKVLWLDKSDKELGREDEPWSSIGEAKEALEANDKLMWEEALRDGNLVYTGDD